MYLVYSVNTLTTFDPFHILLQPPTSTLLKCYVLYQHNCEIEAKCDVFFALLSQYFVESPYTTIATSSLLVYSSDIFSHASL